jgi:hypothetical protein
VACLPEFLHSCIMGGGRLSRVGGIPRHHPENVAQSQSDLYHLRPVWDVPVYYFYLDGTALVLLTFFFVLICMYFDV